MATNYLKFLCGWKTQRAYNQPLWPQLVTERLPYPEVRTQPRATAQFLSQCLTLLVV
jgi:hypothetical protein